MTKELFSKYIFLKYLGEFVSEIIYTHIIASKHSKNGAILASPRKYFGAKIRETERRIRFAERLATKVFIRSEDTNDGMAPKVYEGQRVEGVSDVTVNGQPFLPRTTGFFNRYEEFAWGYSGGGPLALAVALLADNLESKNLENVEDLVFELRHSFVQEKIETIKTDKWSMTSEDIKQWLEWKGVTRQGQHVQVKY